MMRLDTVCKIFRYISGSSFVSLICFHSSFHRSRSHAATPQGLASASSPCSSGPFVKSGCKRFRSGSNGIIAAGPRFQPCDRRRCSKFWKREGSEQKLLFQPTKQMRNEAEKHTATLQGPFGAGDGKILHKIVGKYIVKAMKDITVAMDLSDRGGPIKEIGESLGKAYGKLWQSTSTGLMGTIAKRVQKHAKQKEELNANGGKRKASVAKRDNGKNHAGNLEAWKAEVEAARNVLRQEGYKGSMCLKAGMPLHNKICEMRTGRATSAQPQKRRKRIIS